MAFVDTTAGKHVRIVKSVHQGKQNNEFLQLSKTNKLAGTQVTLSNFIMQYKT